MILFAIIFIGLTTCTILTVILVDEERGNARLLKDYIRNTHAEEFAELLRENVIAPTATNDLLKPLRRVLSYDPVTNLHRIEFYYPNLPSVTSLQNIEQKISVLKDHKLQGTYNKWQQAALRARIAGYVNLLLFFVLMLYFFLT